MKDFKKYYTIPTEPELLYQALTTAHTIRLWSGEEAVMTPEVGTEFSLWNGSICGVNLAFEPFKLIQQEWYFGEQEAPSIVTFKIHPHKKGTSVELLHTNIPDDAYDDMVEGWNEAYFGSLLDFYDE